MDTKKNICVFCSSSSTVDEKYFSLARELGGLIARNGYGLVFGGTESGLMKTVAYAVHENGGHVIGVMPGFLARLGVARSGAVDEFVEADCLSDRKAVMIERSDAFIAIAGGFGTFDEIGDVLTQRILRCHKKPMVIVNTDGFYDDMFALFEKFYAQKFAQPVCRGLYMEAKTAQQALDMINGYKAPDEERWF